MTTISIDLVDFRSRVSSMSDPVEYPDAEISSAWDLAVIHHGTNDTSDGCIDDEVALRVALTYLAAHFVLSLRSADSSTQGGGLSSSSLTSISVDQLSMSMGNGNSSSGIRSLQTSWHDLYLDLVESFCPPIFGSQTYQDPCTMGGMGFWRI